MSRERNASRLGAATIMEGSSIAADIDVIRAGQRFPLHSRTFLKEWWSPRQLHIPVRTGGIFYLLRFTS